MSDIVVESQAGFPVSKCRNFFPMGATGMVKADAD
jgi:hypothetical protein